MRAFNQIQEVIFGWLHFLCLSGGLFVRHSVATYMSKTSINPENLPTEEHLHGTRKTSSS